MEKSSSLWWLLRQPAALLFLRLQQAVLLLSRLRPETLQLSRPQQAALLLSRVQPVLISCPLLARKMPAALPTSAALFCWLLLAVQSTEGLFMASSMNADGCDSAIYRVLDDPRRSPLSVSSRGEDLLCDDLLPPGWYRLMAGNQLQGRLPRSCPGAGVCGTQAPVWLEAPPPANGTQVDGQACVSWPFPGSSPDCCLFTIPVVVKNCGPFLSYYLQPTQACAVAYCIEASQEEKSTGYAGGHATANRHKPSATGRTVEQPADDPAANENNRREKQLQSQVASARRRAYHGPSAAVAPAAGINSTRSGRHQQRSRPHISVRIVKGKLQFNCSVEIKSRGKKIIVWSKISGDSDGMIDLAIEELRGSYHLLTADRWLQPGDKVVCEVDGVPSAPQLTGLSVEPTVLHLREDGVPLKIRVIQHTPVICRSGGDCGARLLLQTRSSSGVWRSPDISLSACSVPLRSGLQGCQSQGPCGEAALEVVANMDLILDGETTNFIDLAIVTDSSSDWEDLPLPSLEVKVSDLQPAYCHVYTDPHIITFDGARYDLYSTGTFVLFKSLDLESEIHIRTWDCASLGRGVGVSCVCGLVVREGAEKLSLDMCGGGELPQLSLLSLTSSSLKTRILEARGGKILMFEMESGRSVRVHLEYWGLSVSLQVTGADHGYTRGLCGMYDGDKRNDFHDKQGRILDIVPVYGQVHHFVQRWRLKPGSSMFDALPTLERRSKKGRGGRSGASGRIGHAHFTSCSCRDETEIVTADLTDVGPQYMPGQARRACQEAAPTLRHLLHATDISPMVTSETGAEDEAGRWLDFPRDQPQGDSASSDAAGRPEGFGVYWTLRQPQLTKRPSSAGQSKPKSAAASGSAASRRSRSTTADSHLYMAHPESSYIFPGDLSGVDDEPLILNYPTPGGLTEDDVYELCTQVVMNSTVARECGEYLDSVMQALDICILDVSLMDDTAWASFSLSLVETLCEAALLAGQLTWPQAEVAGGQLQVPPQHIQQALNCPNLCSGHGSCNGKACICDQGYASYDCSQFEAVSMVDPPPAIPYLYMAGDNSICDMEDPDTQGCSTIQVLGQDFISASTGNRLSCSLRSLSTQLEAESNHNWQVEARPISDKLVECLMNRGQRPPVLAVLPVILEVRLLNNDQLYSNEVFLTLYNSSCSSCPEGRMPQHPTVCSERTDICRLGDSSANSHPTGSSSNYHCFPIGAAHPYEPCLSCSDSQWTKRIEDDKDGDMHIFAKHQTALHSVQGDRLVYSLPLLIPPDDVQLNLVKAPAQMKMQGHRLEWIAEPSPRQTEDWTEIVEVVVEGRNPCRESESLVIQITVERCSCLNGGWCERGGPGSGSDGPHISCRCPDRYSGPLCEVPLSLCDPSPCFYGYCLENGGQPTCICDTGFQGEFCEERLDLCASNPCYPGVSCSSTEEGLSCGPCPAGLLGDGITCAPPSVCNPNPCYPGVSCTAKAWYFKCGACPTAMSGDGISCFSSKMADSVTCTHGAECEVYEEANTNATTTFVASTALTISMPSVTNSVATTAPSEKAEVTIVQAVSVTAASYDYGRKPCHSNPCHQNVSCTDINATDFYCGPFPQGFKGDGEESLRDYCEPSPCYQNVTCTTTPTGFNCGECPAGYTGDGIQCRDICRDLSCYPGVGCLLRDGAPVCGPCPSGLLGDGVRCHADPCREHPCYANVDCIPRNLTDYECGPCPRGYIGDGRSCHRNVCSPNPCYLGVECEPSSSGDGFSCGSCPRGLVGDGVKCLPSPCTSNPCYPGVECIDGEEVGSSYLCGPCPQGLQGDGVSCMPDHCAQHNPCHKDVDCRNEEGGARCGPCPAGTVGDGLTCSAPEDPCSGSPCYPGVTCLNLWMGRSAGFVCGSCPDSMVGDGVTCVRTDPCSPSPCYPGVNCTADLPSGRHHCGPCPPGLGGDGHDCGVPDPCRPNPCFPGVACQSRAAQTDETLEASGNIGVSDFECGVCPPGMHGDGRTCTDIDDCRPNPCWSAGACQDVAAPQRGYICAPCPPHLVGDGVVCSQPPASIPCPPTVRCYPGARCRRGPGGQVACAVCPPGMEGDGVLCRPHCFPACNAHQKCSVPECASTAVLQPAEAEHHPEQHRHQHQKQLQQQLVLNNPDLNNSEKLLQAQPTKLGGNALSRAEAATQLRDAVAEEPQQHAVVVAVEDDVGDEEEMVAQDGSASVAFCDKPCRNGGRCVGRNTCSCAQGWRGKRCHKPRCAGGCKLGRCVGPNVCSCPPGSSGKNCMMPGGGGGGCYPPCENGGRCRKNGSCKCSPGYYGKACTNHRNDVTPHQLTSKVDKAQLIQRYLAAAAATPLPRP